MKNRIIIFTYLIITAIFIINAVLHFYDYSLYGYWSDKILNISWLLLTLVLIIFFWRKKAIKYYCYSLISILILSILPMAAPFLGIVYYFIPINDFQQIKLNDEYRIERTRNSPLSMDRVYVYKRAYNILEKNICRPSYQEIINTCTNKNQIDINTPINNAKFIDDNNGLVIEYEILGNKKTIKHSIHDDYGY